MTATPTMLISAIIYGIVLVIAFIVMCITCLDGLFDHHVSTSPAFLARLWDNDNEFQKRLCDYECRKCEEKIKDDEKRRKDKNYDILRSQEDTILENLRNPSSHYLTLDDLVFN